MMDSIPPNANNPGADKVRKERADSIENALEGLTSAMSYCSTRKLDMDDALVKKLVALRDKYLVEGWTTEDEQEFWPSYQDFVSKLETPIDSLIFSKKKTVIVAWVLSISGLLTLAALIFMLISWASLDSILSQIKLVEEQYKEISTRVSELKVDPTVRRFFAEPEVVSDYSEDERKKIAETEVTEHMGEAICSQVQSQYDLLRDRLDGYHYFLSYADPEIEPWIYASRGKGSCQFLYTERLASNSLSLGNALILRNSLNSYILPVLFGLLGTIAYILRSMAKEISESRLTVTSLVGAGVRIPLGMVCGLAIGWVVGDRSGTAFSQITPWALAFIAGYSVELLFAAMDRIVGAFTDERPATSRK